MILPAALFAFSLGCGKYGSPIRADGTRDNSLDELPMERTLAPGRSERYEPIVDETVLDEPGEFGEPTEPDSDEADAPSEAGDETHE